MNKILLTIGTWIIIFLLTVGLTYNEKYQKENGDELSIFIMAVLFSTALTLLIWGWFL